MGVCGRYCRRTDRVDALRQHRLVSASEFRKEYLVRSIIPYDHSDLARLVVNGGKDEDGTSTGPGLLEYSISDRSLFHRRSQVKHAPRMLLTEGEPVPTDLLTNSK